MGRGGGRAVERKLAITHPAVRPGPQRCFGKKDAPPTALRAEMDLAVGATRATTVELVMADMLTGESCVRWAARGDCAMPTCRGAVGGNELPGHPRARPVIGPNRNHTDEQSRVFVK